ncbi:lpxtg-motif cell wall anchor domain protein [Limosilactobacillus ingluviei]|uniref:Lpxtg-motif cell wall anchor domain protein n=2 Tax=Limosilactobacillus ingluviei TaxID=148604 RepID=A0A0R2H104_9LACO|nr:lpxtg-motif cell wall anchor domain protein [Limosilactobacillus ingluviei]
MYEELAKNAESNRYQSNAYDAKRNVNINNLSQDDQMELSYYVAKLVNEMRDQWGTSSKVGYLVPTIGVTAMAKNIANGYQQDQWTLDKGHDVPRINEVAKDYGLTYGGNYYENASQNYLAMYNDAGNTTMDKLKQGIYESLLGLIFEDGNSKNGHMKSLLGLDANSVSLGALPTDEKKTYFGFGINSVVQGSDSDVMHYILVTNLSGQEGTVSQYITDLSKFESLSGTIPVSYVDPAGALKAKLTELNTTLATQNDTLTKATNADTLAQGELTTAKATLDTAQKTADQAQEAVTAAQKTLTGATNALIQAQTSLVNAKKQLADDQAALAQKQATLATYKQGNEEKLANLEKAQGILKDAQTALQAAQNELAKDQQALNDAKQALSAKQKAVTDAQNQKQADEAKLTQLKNQLNDIQNAPRVLAQAKAALDQANQALTAAKDQLAKETKALAPLQEAVEAAKDELADAESFLKAAQAHQADVQASLDAAKAAQEALLQKEALQKELAEQQAKLAAQKEAQANGYQVQGDKVVDSEGKPVAGWKVADNGMLLAPNGAVVAPAKADKQNVTSTQQTALKTPQTRAEYKAQQTQANKLPQTGNEEAAALGLLGLAGSLMAMVGLNKKRKA